MDLFMMCGGVVVAEGSGDTGRWRERGIRSDHPSPDQLLQSRPDM